MKRTIMYIFIAIIIVALVFSVGLLKEKDNSDSNLKTIQLNEVTRSVFYAPQYVAITRLKVRNNKRSRGR